MERDRDYKLDVIKSVAIVFVLLWHLQPIRVPFAEVPPAQYTLYYLIYFFYHNICLLAVPVFYIVSLLLFHRKLSENYRYIGKRLKRILFLYTFWSIVQTFIYLLVNYSCSIIGIDISLWINDTGSLFKWIVVGGPALPVVGGSVFYFLSNLLILTVVSSVYFNRAQIYISYILVIILLAYFFVCSWLSISIPYWRLDNFLIYVPISHVLYESFYNKSGSSYFMLIIFILLITAGFVEIYAKINLDHKFSSYSRISIVFGSIFIFKIIQSINFKKEFTMCRYLSKYSLGIYSLHKYWMLFFVVIFSKIIIFEEQNWYISFGEIRLSLFYLLVSILSLVCVFGSINILRCNIYTRKVIS